MITKQTYELVASVIRSRIESAKYESQWDEAEEIAKVLADKFAANNPRFNRERFLIACGVAQ